MNLDGEGTVSLGQLPLGTTPCTAITGMRLLCWHNKGESTTTVSTLVIPVLLSALC